MSTLVKSLRIEKLYNLYYGQLKCQVRAKLLEYIKWIHNSYLFLNPIVADKKLLDIMISMQAGPIYQVLVNLGYQADYRQQ